MPELPEVETVIRGLRKTIIGKTIARVSVDAPPSSIVVSSSFDSLGFIDILKGKKILDVTRRGKNILISLSNDITLWVHLKMTGHFFYLERKNPRQKHDLVTFDFKAPSGKLENYHLRFNDYRRFGRLRLFHNNEVWKQEGLKKLGPEPLKITASDFTTLCKKSHRMIKPALLDQTFIAGLGNIYADESLYAARIHPQRIISSLSGRKIVELHGHIQRLLKKAIRLMGTTVDSYSGVNGQTGRFQKYLLAYNQEGKPCQHCGTKIIREKIGSRSAHYCPRCQRLK